MGTVSPQEPAEVPARRAGMRMPRLPLKGRRNLQLLECDLPYAGGARGDGAGEGVLHSEAHPFEDVGGIGGGGLDGDDGALLG